MIKTVKILQRLYEQLFPLPKVCPLCLKRQASLQICPECGARALQKRSLEGQCQRCHSFGIQSGACQNCRQWPEYLLGNIAVWPYEGLWQQAILDFKFRNKPWLAEALAAAWLPVLPAGFDLLIPVPLHRNRLRERGYNQSALLTQALAEQSGVVWQEGLLRVRDTPHQTGLVRAQRLTNLEDAFALRPQVDVAGKRVIVVDDVFTTGATLRQCAKTLHRHGASEIMGLTLAGGRSHF